MNENLIQYFNGDELAASVWQGKYAQAGEETPNDMHKRMAREFAKIEDYYQQEENPYADEHLSAYGKEREPLTEESIYELFKNFKYIVPQGSVMSMLGSDKIGSLSNCFVVGQPYDSYGGIMQKDEQLAQLMKRRGGVGIDISTLRPAGTKVTNAAGTSTGAISFMERFSNTTREVAQNGRRGALMISMDIRHPDIEEFITIKQDLSKVTGANISIQLRDDFMEAVRKNEDYILRFPCDFDNEDFINGLGLKNNEISWINNNETGKQELILKKVRAREVWDKIIQAAHASAEPGLMFLDKHWDYSPDGVYPQYRGVTTNP